jgi:hypothetical protein
MTTETTREAAQAAPDMEAVRAFELDRDSSVMLTCPDCGELFWLSQGEDAETLGDVIDAVAAHECRGYDPYGSGEGQPS